PGNDRRASSNETGHDDDSTGGEIRASLCYGGSRGAFSVDCLAITHRPPRFQADVSGAKAGDVDVSYENGVLTIEGKVQPRPERRAELRLAGVRRQPLLPAVLAEHL